MLENAIDVEDFDCLPVPVYLVSASGKFIYGNRMLRDFLGLPTGDISSFQITDFYADPAQRDAILAKVRQLSTQGGRGGKQVASFKISGRECIVALFCQPLSRDGVFLGYFGCIVDITDDEKQQRLLDLLPAGVFQVDESGNIIRANTALVRLLSVERREDLEGVNFDSLFCDADDAKIIVERVRANQRMEKFETEMNRASGQKFFASLNAVPVFTFDGLYGGYEGTIEDVTEREQLRIIFTEFPLGTYVVHDQGGLDVVVNCNDRFAQMFDYPSSVHVIGREIEKLHKGSKDYGKFMTALSDAHARGEPLLGYWLKTTTHGGRRVTLEINCRAREDKDGKIIGRIGVVREVSGEATLREQVKTFTSDIGNVLHTYSSLLVMVKTAVAPVCDSLVLDLVRPDGQNFEYVDLGALEEEMFAAANTLVAALEELLTISEISTRAVALSEGDWKELRSTYFLMSNIRARISVPEFQPPTLRELAHRVRLVLDRVKEHGLPRELVRKLRTEAKRLERVCCLISLNKVQDATIEMDYQVRALRDYVTKGVRREEKHVLRSMSDIVRQSISNITEFARSRKVEIRRPTEMKFMVDVVERDIVRAVTNLLHNAIKYSWSRNAGELPWVVVKCRVEGREVHLEIENYGVPIPRDEIRTGHIFHVGTRGRLASDRGRIGTGIGLADAREVARYHNGEVTVESRPASYGKEDDFSRPFLTTAKLTLALADSAEKVQQ